MFEPTAILFGVATMVVALRITALIVPGVVYEGPMGLVGAAILYKSFILGLQIWPVESYILAAMGPLRMVGSTLIFAALLWIVGKTVPGFAVNGLGGALLGALVVGVAQFSAGFLVRLAAMDPLTLFF
ncbi:MAG: phage holin family protein [Gemmatimonadota bacterium]|jgi:uncharacterized membrane protein YvlD (DUF360 family)